MIFNIHNITSTFILYLCAIIIPILLIRFSLYIEKTNQTKNFILFNFIFAFFYLCKILNQFSVSPTYYFYFEKLAFFFFSLFSVATFFIVSQKIEIKKTFSIPLLALFIVFSIFSTISPFFFTTKELNPSFTKNYIYFSFFQIAIYISSIFILAIRTKKYKFSKKKIFTFYFAIIVLASITLFQLYYRQNKDISLYVDLAYIVPLIFMSFAYFKQSYKDIFNCFCFLLIGISLPILAIVPNFFLFNLGHQYLVQQKDAVIFIILFIVFITNIYYITFLTKILSHLFLRKKYSLRKMEVNFINNISILKNKKQLNEQLTLALKNNFKFQTTDLFVYKNENFYINSEQKKIELTPQLIEIAIKKNYFTRKKNLFSDYSLQKDENFLNKIENYEFDYFIPLVREEKLVGFINATSISKFCHLSKYSRDSLMNIANATALALTNSLMYQDLNDLNNNLEIKINQRIEKLKTANERLVYDLNVAKKVQQSLLPKELFYSENIKITAKIKPLMEVSGDHYEVIELPNDRIAIALIDISGHGVPAALLTSMIDAELKKQLLLNTRTDKICSAINQNLTPVLIETGFYFTMFLAIYDRGNNNLQYTNCGHNEPFLINLDSEIEKLTTDGFLMGANPNAEFAYLSTKLFPGERIFLYTDGVPEARDRYDHFLGEKTFQKHIFRSLNLDIKDQLEFIFSKVEDFQKDAEHTDDISLIIIEGGIPLRATPLIKNILTEYIDQNYEKALQDFAKIPTTDLTEDLFYLQARIYQKIQQRTKALYYINKALEIRNLVEYHYLKAIILLENNNIFDAEDEFLLIKKRSENYKQTNAFLENIKKKK